MTPRYHHNGWGDDCTFITQVGRWDVYVSFPSTRYLVVIDSNTCMSGNTESFVLSSVFTNDERRQLRMIYNMVRQEG